MTSIRVAALATLSLAAVPLAAGSQGHRKNINDASLAALDKWVAAVEAHAPGSVDASVVTVASWSHGDREDLNTGVELFLTALMGWTFNTDGNRAAQVITERGRAAGKDFLKRAAVLHSDAAAYNDLLPQKEFSESKPRGREREELQVGRGATPMGLRYSEPIPPLLMEDRVILNQDGQILGHAVSTWNWPFARSLLDLLSAGSVRRIFSDGKPARATDPFVSAWYHATTAYMFARGFYGDATPHLHHASMVLPDDPLAVFDRASYSEILGLPSQQALIPEPDIGQRARAGGEPSWKTPGSEPVVNIPAAGKTNAEAEDLFRRALTLDPSLVEARVRLARLLHVRGRRQEAAAELEVVFASKPVGVVAYYAHLFAGRVAESAGGRSEAAAHFTEASTLFPDAQSALLALSHHALLQADVPAAVAPVARLGARSANFDSDPWWKYDLAAGRDADVLLKQMWARVPR